MEEKWQGKYRQETFQFEGRQAILVIPEKPNGKWLLKTEYFAAFPELEEEMVGRGYHLAYLQNLNRWGIPEDLDAKYRFRNFLVERYHLSPRCIPIGMSCGGLHAIKQAGRHPDMVSVIYADAPVMNILSCPFGFGAKSEISESARQEALDALGITFSQLLSYRDHPLDYIDRLTKARIPLALVCGDADRIVPYEENGALLKAAYEQTDIPFYFQLKPGCDHHPHGPGENQIKETADFLCQWDR